MLSSDLQFLYLDPVLTTHLEEQADLLVGKPLLSFIHPDEQASAQHDLGEVLKSKTVHGSVTRYVQNSDIHHYHRSTRTFLTVFVFVACPKFGGCSAMRVHLQTGLTPKRLFWTMSTWL